MAKEKLTTMKKLFYLFSALALATCLAGCAKSQLVVNEDDDDYKTWQAEMMEAEAENNEWELNPTE